MPAHKYITVQTNNRPACVAISVRAVPLSALHDKVGNVPSGVASQTHVYERFCVEPVIPS